MEKITSAIAGLRATEEKMAEKLDAVTAEQVETRKALLELKARQGLVFVTVQCVSAPHRSHRLTLTV